MSKNLIEKIKQFFDVRFGRTQAYVEIYNALETLQDFLMPRIFFLKVLIDKYELSKIDESLYKKISEALTTTTEPLRPFDAYLQVLEEIVLNESLRFDEKLKHINAATATFKDLCETIHLSDLYRATVKFFPDVFTQSDPEIQEKDEAALLPLISFYTQFKPMPQQEPFKTFIMGRNNYMAKVRCVDDYEEEIVSRMENIDSAENLVFFLSMMNCDFLQCFEPIKFATQKLLFGYIQKNKPVIDAFLENDILISRLYDYLRLFCQLPQIRDIDCTQSYPANEETRLIEMLNKKLKEGLGIDCNPHDAEPASQASNSPNTQKKKRRRRRKKKQTTQAASSSSMGIASKQKDEPPKAEASSSGVSEAKPSVAFKLYERRRPPNPYNAEEISCLIEAFEKQFSKELPLPKFKVFISYIETLVYEEKISIQAHMIIEILRFIRYATNTDFEEEKWQILASLDLLHHLINITFAIYDINETLLSLKTLGEVPSEEAYWLNVDGEKLQFLFQCADKLDAKKERLTHAPSEYIPPKITQEMHSLIDRVLNVLFDKLLHDGLFDIRIEDTEGIKTRVVNEINLVELLNSGINLFELVAQALPTEEQDLFLFNFMLVVLMGLQEEENESLSDLFSMTLITRFEALTSARRHENPLLDQMALTLMFTPQQSLAGDLFHEQARLPFMERMASVHSEQALFKATIEVMGKILAYTKLDESAALETLSRTVGSSILYYQLAKPEKQKVYRQDFVSNLFFIDPLPANILNSGISVHSNYEEIIACYFIFSLLLNPEQREFERIVKAYQIDFSLNGTELTFEQQDFIESRRYLRNLGFLWAFMQFDPAAKSFYAQTIFYYLDRIEQNESLDKSSSLSSALLAEIFLNLRLEISGNFEERPVYPLGVWGEHFSEANLMLRQSLPADERPILDKETEQSANLEALVILMLNGGTIEAEYFHKATEMLPWSDLFSRDQAWMKLYLKIIVPVCYAQHENVTILSSYLKMDDFDGITIAEVDLIHMDSIDAALLLLFLFIAQKSGRYLSCFSVFERFITTGILPDMPFEERACLETLLLDVQRTVSGPERKLTPLTETRFEQYDQQIALAFLKFSMTSIQKGRFYELEPVPFVEVLHAMAVFSSSRYFGLDIDTFILVLDACPNQRFIGTFLHEVFVKNLDKAAYHPFINKINYYCAEVGDWTQPLIALHEKLKAFPLSKRQKRQLNSIFNPAAQHQQRFVKETKLGIQFQINELKENQTSDFESYFEEIKSQYHIPENMDGEFRKFTEKLFQANQNKRHREKVNALKDGMKPKWVLKQTENPDDAILKAMEAARIPEEYFEEIHARFQKILKKTKSKMAKQAKSMPETSEKQEKPSGSTTHAANEVPKRDFADRIRALDLSALANANGLGKAQSMFKHNPREFLKLDASCRNKLLEFMQLHAVERFVFIQKYAGSDINATAKKTLRTFLDNWAALGQACQEAKNFLEQINALHNLPEVGRYFALGIVPLGKATFKFFDTPYHLSVYECDSEEGLTALINASENFRELRQWVGLLHHKMSQQDVSFESDELDRLIQKVCLKTYACIKPNERHLSEAHAALLDLNYFFEHDLVIAARALFGCLSDIGCFFDVTSQRLFDIGRGADFEIESILLEQCFLLHHAIDQLQEAGGSDIYDLEALKQIIVRRYTNERPIKLFCLIHEAYEQENVLLLDLLHQALWKKFDVYLCEILERQIHPECKEGNSEFSDTVYGLIPRNEESIKHNLELINNQLQLLYTHIPDAWLFGGMVFNFFSERSVQTLEHERFDLDLIAPGFETAEELIECLTRDPDLRARLATAPFCPCKKELPHLVRLKFITGFEVDIEVGDPSNLTQALTQAKGYCPLTALQMARQFTPGVLPFSGVTYQTYLDDLDGRHVRFPNLQGKIACIEEPGESAILLALMMKAEYKKGCVIDAAFKAAFAKQVDSVFEGLFQPNERNFYLVKSKLQEMSHYPSQEDEIYQGCIGKLKTFVSDYTIANRANREKYGQFSPEGHASGGASQSGVIMFDCSSLNEQIRCVQTMTDITRLMKSMNEMFDKQFVIPEPLMLAFNAKAMDVVNKIDAMDPEEIEEMTPIYNKMRQSEQFAHIKPLLEKLEEVLTDYQLQCVRAV